MGKKILLFFIIRILFTGSLSSQAVTRLPFNKKISVDDGLSSYNVKKIIQDKYGFIWIVTQDGLNRFDGRNFVVYSKSADPGHRLLESDVWDVEEYPNSDTIWVATAYGGINGIDLTTGKLCFALRTIESEGLNNNWCRYVQRYKNELWIGTYNGLAIYDIQKQAFETFEPLPLDEKIKNFCIDKIVIDRYENAWLLIANYGIVIYSCKNKAILGAYPLSKLSLRYEPTFRQFHFVSFLPGGELLAATNQGFRRYTATQAGKISTHVGLYDGDTGFNRISINAVNVDSFQNVWFSTAAKFFRFEKASRRIEEIKDANEPVQNDWLNNMYAIHFDRDNNIWVGTQRGVSFTKNVAPVFTSFYKSEDQAAVIGHALYLYPFSDSITYACTETGLLKVNTLLNKIQQVDKGKAYYFMRRHADSNFLVSNQNGFYVYKPGESALYEIFLIYPELGPLNQMTVNCILYHNDSMAVLGTENGDGSFIWEYKKKALHKITTGLNGEEATPIVNTIYNDKKNRVWILGDKYISIYDPKTRTVKNITLIHPSTHLPLNIYFDVCEARSFYWLAVYGSGLIQLNNDLTIKNIFSIKEGLSNEGVYKVFPVNDSLVFVTTNRGLSVFNIDRQAFTNYYVQDGLHSNAFEEGCGAYRNKKIYAGGLNGFTIIDPDYLSYNRIAPSLYLDHIRIKTIDHTIDTSNLSLQTIDIPNDVLQTTFYFSALNYADPSRTAYAYQIKELNKSWIDLGNENSVSIMGLLPGRYTLLVKSANQDGVWNKEPVVVSLHYLPKWYQTLLFKILVIGAIAALLYSFYAYRISQLKKQQKIRKDISADLHDDIGSILEGVKIFTHLAKKEPHQQAHLKRIEESITQASTGFRDIIWILDDKQDTCYQFMERIKKLALPIANANDIQLHCSVEDGLNERTLSKSEKRHMLMIVKESINNSIKYSGCKNIQVVIRLFQNKLAVMVIDDGRGFDAKVASEGNGLKNIVYRAGQIGFQAEIISGPGEGCVVRVVRK